jgi:hypothetical protein
MPTQAEAIAAWTAHYEADLGAARARILHMNKHGIPEGHIAERVGAAIALTPHENRCEHYGDRTNCVQCFTERRATEAAEREAERNQLREQQRREAEAAAEAEQRW